MVRRTALALALLAVTSCSLPPPEPEPELFTDMAELLASVRDTATAHGTVHTVSVTERAGTITTTDCHHRFEPRGSLCRHDDGTDAPEPTSPLDFDLPPAEVTAVRARVAGQEVSHYRVEEPERTVDVWLDANGLPVQVELTVLEGEDLVVTTTTYDGWGTTTPA